MFGSKRADEADERQLIVEDLRRRDALAPFELAAETLLRLWGGAEPRAAHIHSIQLLARAALPLDPGMKHIAEVEAHQTLTFEALSLLHVRGLLMLTATTGRPATYALTRAGTRAVALNTTSAVVQQLRTGN